MANIRPNELILQLSVCIVYFNGEIHPLNVNL